MGFADYLENEALNFVFGNSGEAVPDFYYIGLATGTILEDGSNLSLVEVTGTPYARIQVSNDVSSSGWILEDSGLIKNSGIITFSEATSDWGIINQFFVSRSLTASTGLMTIGTLTVNKEINNGDTFYFNTGEISITLD